MDRAQGLKEQGEGISRYPASGHYQSVKTFPLEERVNIIAVHPCEVRKFLKNLAIMITCAAEITKGVVDIDRLVVMAFLRPDWLTISICVERRSVPKCGNLEVEWQVLAESMDIVNNEGLIRTLQMVEVINLKEYSFYSA